MLLSTAAAGAPAPNQEVQAACVMGRSEIGISGTAFIMAL
jgi:hypothetical protein